MSAKVAYWTSIFHWNCMPYSQRNLGCFQTDKNQLPVNRFFEQSQKYHLYWSSIASRTWRSDFLCTNFCEYIVGLRDSGSIITGRKSQRIANGQAFINCTKSMSIDTGSKTRPVRLDEVAKYLESREVSFSMSISPFASYPAKYRQRSGESD